MGVAGFLGAARGGNVIDIILRGHDQASKEFKTVEGSMARMTAFIQKHSFFIATAAAGAAAGFVALAVKTAQYGDRILELSQKTGADPVRLQELAYHAKLAGVDMETLAAKLALLNRTLWDIRHEGGPDAVQALNELGITVDQLEGKDVVQVFALIADGMERARARGEDVSGTIGKIVRGGADLIPIMEGGAKAINKSADALSRFGGAMSPAQVAQAAKAADAIDEFNAAAAALGRDLSIGALPVLTDLLMTLTAIFALRPPPWMSDQAIIGALYGTTPPTGEKGTGKLFRRAGWLGDYGPELPPVLAPVSAQHDALIAQADATLKWAEAYVKLTAAINAASAVDLEGVQPSGRAPSDEPGYEAPDRRRQRRQPDWKLVESGRDAADRLHAEIQERIAAAIATQVDAAAKLQISFALAYAPVDALARSMTLFTDTLIRGGNVFKIQFGNVAKQIMSQLIAQINQAIARMLVFRAVSLLFGPMSGITGFVGSAFGMSSSRGSSSTQSVEQEMRRVMRSSEFRRAMRDDAYASGV